MPLSAHLAELQRRVRTALVAVAVGAVAGYVVFPRLLTVLISPYCEFAQDRLGDPSCALVVLSPLQPLSLRVTGAALFGVVAAWPVVSWQAWRFVAPGLTRSERRWVVSLTVAGQLLLAAGAVCSFLLSSTALSVLLAIAGPEVQPLLDASSYLRFLVTMGLSFGLLFQLPVVVVGLVALGVVSTATLRRRRREVLVATTLIAAVVTPTGDAVTLTMAVAVLTVLFEASVLFGRLLERRRAARAARS